MEIKDLKICHPELVSESFETTRVILKPVEILKRVQDDEQM